jgi:hypothetical protein
LINCTTQGLGSFTALRAEESMPTPCRIERSGGQHKPAVSDKNQYLTAKINLTQQKCSLGARQWGKNTVVEDKGSFLRHGSSWLVWVLFITVPSPFSIVSHVHDMAEICLFLPAPKPPDRALFPVEPVPALLAGLV